MWTVCTFNYISSILYICMVVKSHIVGPGVHKTYKTKKKTMAIIIIMIITLNYTFSDTLEYGYRSRDNLKKTKDRSTQQAEACTHEKKVKNQWKDGFNLICMFCNFCIFLPSMQCHYFFGKIFLSERFSVKLFPGWSETSRLFDTGL